MQAKNSQPWAAVLFAASLLAAVTSGCAVAEKSYHFTTHSITKIYYDPKNCTEQPDGKFKCNDVIFTVSSIEPVKK